MNPKYFKPELNTPYQIALKYPTGKLVNGFRGVQELRWILMDGRAFYTPLSFQRQIEDANIRPGQSFTVEKRVNGSRAEWSVTRPESPTRGNSRAAQEAIRLINDSEALDAPVLENHPQIPPTQLEHALKTAVAAAAAAEKHAERLGYSCRFSSADIRAMGISVLIGMDRGRAA